MLEAYNFIKTPAKAFSCEFCKIINNFYFAKCLRTAASLNMDAGEKAVRRIYVPIIDS